MWGFGVIISSFSLNLVLASNVLCPFDGLKYPSAKCNAYFVCKNGQFEEIYCEPQNLYYNCENQLCENITHCCAVTTPGNPGTSTVNGDNSSSPKKPSSSSTTSSSQSTEKTTKKEGNTSSSTLPRDPLCPFDHLKYPSEECNSYFACRKGQLVKTNCQPLNLHYNCEKHICDNSTHCCGKPTPSSSTTTSTKQPPNVLCSIDGLKYPSTTPGDCGGYFQCQGGQLVKLECPNGLTYNCRKEDCEFQENPHCCGGDKN